MQVAKIRFADFKPADTGYHMTPDMASVSCGVSIVLKAVGELKVPWIDDRSLENRYLDEPDLRSTIGQIVEYMIDQHVPYGFHSIRRYHLLAERLRLLRDATMRARRHDSFTVVNNGTMVNQFNFLKKLPTHGERVFPSPKSFDSQFESDDLAPIHVALQWIRGPRVPRDQETEEAIEEAAAKGIEIPQTNQTLPWDPRICANVYQFRDKIRRLMGCRDVVFGNVVQFLSRCLSRCPFRCLLRRLLFRYFPHY